jgi:hypothetical protein
MSMQNTLLANTSLHECSNMLIYSHVNSAVSHPCALSCKRSGVLQVNNKND